MPNDYAVAREARKGPKITMGKGMHQVLPSPSKVYEQKTPDSPETPGRKIQIPEPRVYTENKLSPKEGQVGQYSDKVKIPEPKFQELERGDKSIEKI